jgi:hypothetical protein
MYVIKSKNKQKEWHPATKPFFNYETNEEKRRHSFLNYRCFAIATRHTCTEHVMQYGGMRRGMMLAGLADVEVASAAADRPPLLASGSWGVGVMAVLQAVTGSPLHTAPLLVTQGGGRAGGLRDDLPVPTRTVGNLEPQPMAGKAGWYRQEGWRVLTGRLAGINRKAGGYRQEGWRVSTGRLAGIDRKAGGYRQEGWRVSTGRLAGIDRKAGGELRKAGGEREGWQGTRKAGREGKEGWRGMKYNFGLDAMNNPRNSISSDTDTYKLCYILTIY